MLAPVSYPVLKENDMGNNERTFYKPVERCLLRFAQAPML